MKSNKKQTCLCSHSIDEHVGNNQLEECMHKDCHCVSYEEDSQHDKKHLSSMDAIRGKEQPRLMTLTNPADKRQDNSNSLGCPAYFKYEYCKTQEEVRKHIQEDEGKCTQQVCYSTFHDALTQINFTGRIIRSNLRI